MEVNDWAYTWLTEPSSVIRRNKADVQKYGGLSAKQVVDIAAHERWAVLLLGDQIVIVKDLSKFKMLYHPDF